MAQYFPDGRLDSEVVGTPRVEKHPAESHRESQGVDGRTVVPLRWVGRHLSSDDVLGDGVGCFGLRPQRSVARGSAAPVQQPDGGRWRAVLFPAVLLAG